ncbi:MAG: M28 family peptidase [Oscillospiraceae bacterium]|nr:M28 family peptidase [Oscillospiraceae bacterium]
MNRYAERILREYPVRRRPEEKEKFRLWLMGTLRELGYQPELQSRQSALQFGGNVLNVVAGDPERAKLILVAHYDTAIRSLLPPMYMPTRPLTAFLYLALTPALVLIGSFVLSFALTFPINAPYLTLPLFLLLLVTALLYLRFGPSERRNLNDNTSGVAALLETAATLTPRDRGHVAFAFLDGGFGGLSGAKGFRARYPSAKEKTIINLCSVAEGSELLVLPNKNSRWDGALLDAILDSFENGEHTTVFLKTDGLTYFPSDNRAFRYACSICACETVRGFGRLVCPLKATDIDEEKTQILKNGLCKLIERYQKA